MARLIKRSAANSGGFKPTGKVIPLKNLVWLFKHATQVTEMHFDKTPAGMTAYILRAYMMNGDIYECEFADRSAFCTVFNRSKNLRDVMVFSNWFGAEPCGQLTDTAYLNPANQPALN